MRKGPGNASLYYQTRRGIDGAYGVITATRIGPGGENEAHRLADLLGAHNDNSGQNAEIVVADSKYGTTASFLQCCDRGILAHIPVLKQTQDQQERRRKIFPVSLFTYDPPTDTCSCPAGQTLRKRKHGAERKAFEYVTGAEFASAALCGSNALVLRLTGELSSATSARRFRRSYVSMHRADRQNETYRSASILWSALLLRRHDSVLNEPAGGVSGGYKSRTT